MKKTFVFSDLVYQELLPIIKEYQINDDFYQNISQYSTFKKEKFLDYYLAYQSGKYDNNYLYLLNVVNYPNFLNNAYYQDIYPALSKPVILVNKKFQLQPSYIPSSLHEVTIFKHIARKQKSFASSRIFNDYANLESALDMQNFPIYIYSCYRSYSRQMELENLSNDENLVARAGHSEHQTGLALDLATLSSGLTEHFENTSSFLFLKDNAHQFGFILRYPKNKESITGFSYEPWHYRYVGKEIATIIYQENLTLEEYFYHYVLLDY